VNDARSNRSLLPKNSQKRSPFDRAVGRALVGLILAIAGLAVMAAVLSLARKV
jgi:hypothetical protein